MTAKEARDIARNPENYSNNTRRVAFLKLGNLALLAFPSSPRQRELQAEREKLALTINRRFSGLTRPGRSRYKTGQRNNRESTMYLLRRNKGRDFTMLCEATPAQGRKLLSSQDGYDYTEIPAVQAHRWVASGAPHETALYIGDDQRIRRAG